MSSGCFHRIETGTVERVGGNGRAKGAFAPPSVKAHAAWARRQRGEELGLGTGGGEAQADAARHFDAAGGDRGIELGDARGAEGRVLSRRAPAKPSAARQSVTLGALADHCHAVEVTC
jgi:hypothetical protein